MPQDDPKSLNWLEDLNWRGYPRLAPIRDVGDQGAGGEPVPPRTRKEGTVRLEAVVRENEALRGKIEALTTLATEFERRLGEAASSYEGAALESDSARRSTELENARLAGELESARAELIRRESRDLSRESELALERERRADAEKSLLDARRRLNDLEAELEKARGKSAELAGSISEMRRQADASNERLLQAKALTDQDVHILRSEMREFIAKFHRIQDTLGEKE